jgi:hypothetical protein
MFDRTSKFDHCNHLQYSASTSAKGVMFKIGLPRLYWLDSPLYLRIRGRAKCFDERCHEATSRLLGCMHKS